MADVGLAPALPAPAPRGRENKNKRGGDPGPGRTAKKVKTEPGVVASSQALQKGVKRNEKNPGGTSMSVAKDQEKMKEHLEKLHVNKVLAGETGKSELYQAKRFREALNRKGHDSDAVHLDLCLDVARSASMLTPGECCKLPLDQVKATWAFKGQSPSSLKSQLIIVLL